MMSKASIVAIALGAQCAFAAPSLSLFGREDAFAHTIQRTFNGTSVSIPAACSGTGQACIAWCEGTLNDGDTVDGDCVADCELDYCEAAADAVVVHQGQTMSFADFNNLAIQERIANLTAQQEGVLAPEDLSLCLQTCQTFGNLGNLVGASVVASIIAGIAKVSCQAACLKIWG
ncbi:hypothetical protein F5884DRAFT_25716 [Xylogone sp. PMI_703]|nr:hypothetical protein F5884DRAFT_25716 [Xylogone sp. PMI_703]